MRAMPFVCAFVSLALFPLAAHALSTAFLYQGRLAQAGAAPTGSFDFTFALYDAATGGAQVGGAVSLNGVAVANGLFAAPLDFGAAPFAGADRWLEIGVRAAGGGSHAILAPRQPLAPTPYALFAEAVDWDGILNRPAAFGVYTAGAGLTLTGQQFSVATNGVTGAMLASDAAGLARVSGGVMAAAEGGIAIGAGAVSGPLFQVTVAADTPLGVESLDLSMFDYGNEPIWQSFTAPAAATLAAIQVKLIPDGAGTTALTVYSGVGTGGTVLSTQTVSLTATAGFFTFVLPTPVALTGGQQYTFGLGAFAPWWQVPLGSGYGGGASSHGGYDLVFRLFSAVAANATALAVDRATGNVGIGTGSPAAALEVNGTAKMAGFQLGGSATAGQVLTADAAGVGAWAALPACWRQGGNAFGAAGVLGTTDNFALDVTVNGARALRLEPDATSPNVILGFSGNSVSAGRYGSCIGGGGYAGYANAISENFAVIGGGYNNAVSITGGAIGGGFGNAVSGDYGAIAGGRSNQVTVGYGAVAGGFANQASGSYGAVGGGYNNVVSGSCGMIAGGNACAAGACAFAAGNRAKATQAGSFVWADTQAADLTAPATNSVAIRASGGIWLGTNSSPSLPAGRFLNTSTGGYLSTTGTWTNSCDRTLKTDFAALDGGDLLRKLAALPITAWRYKASAGERHLGPTAQDFRAAFGLGLDDVSISTVDGIGVALAAAQALQAELAGVKAENADLMARLDRLEAALARMAENR